MPSMFTSETLLSMKSIPESELPVIPLVQMPRAAPPLSTQESTMQGSLHPAKRMTSELATRVVLDPKFSRFTSSTRTFPQLVNTIPLLPVVFCPSIAPPEILMKPNGLPAVPVATKAVTPGARAIVPSITTQVSDCSVRGLSPSMTGEVSRKTITFPGLAARAAS